VNELSTILAPTESHSKKGGTMPKKSNQPQPANEIEVIKSKLDAILALLLRQLNDEAVGKWNNQDKQNIVRTLIDLGFDNSDIAKVTGLAYNSVANIRSKYKKEKSK
jgi:hypothetical protein